MLHLYYVYEQMHFVDNSTILLIDKLKVNEGYDKSKLLF